MLPPEQLADLTRQAILAAQAAGALPPTDVPEVTVQPPRRAEHGDLSTSVCLQMARLAKRSPIQIAQVVAAHMPEHEMVGSVDVAPPGFLNFSYAPAWLGRQVEVIREAGEAWGQVDLGHGKRTQVEYGSANPTGPLHVGFGRNVVLGDGIANVLEAAGYDVQREYYVNDALTQVSHLADSMDARYRQLLGQDVPFPEEGYPGEYVTDWAQEVIDQDGDRYLHLSPKARKSALAEIGLNKALTSIRADCATLKINYDHWFSERSLYAGDTYERVLEILDEGGWLYQADGATWFKATAFGESKDEVVIRSNGLPGYFASDIAYHYDKVALRKYEWVIDVWGADHQGHVQRMYGVMRALGLDPDTLNLLIYQMVTIIRGGETVILSKRKGNLVFLKEILDDVGPDATRFFLLQRSADSQMDFDIDLAKKQSDENPVYYVQYAHARIASVLRTAVERGWTTANSLALVEDGDVGLLTHKAELDLIRKMLQMPEVMARAATDLAPHHLCYYAQELASTFHTFYQECRILSSELEDAPLTKARLKLCAAAQHVLANALRIVGVSTPERM